MKIEEKTILTFDCYGTLIDWESGIWDGFQPLLRTNKSNIIRETCLQAFAEAESSVQAQQPDMLYTEILQLTWSFARQFRLQSVPFGQALADFVFHQLLQTARARHGFKLVIYQISTNTSKMNGWMLNLMPFLPQKILDHTSPIQNFAYLMQNLFMTSRNVTQSDFMTLSPKGWLIPYGLTGRVWLRRFVGRNHKNRQDSSG